MVATDLDDPWWHDVMGNDDGSENFDVPAFKDGAISVFNSSV